METFVGSEEDAQKWADQTGIKNYRVVEEIDPTKLAKAKKVIFLYDVSTGCQNKN